MEKNATKMLHFPLQPGEALHDIYHHRQCQNRGNADLFYTKKFRAIPVLFLRFVIKQSYMNHTVSHKLKVIHGFQTSTDLKKEKRK